MTGRGLGRCHPRGAWRAGAWSSGRFGGARGGFGGWRAGTRWYGRGRGFAGPGEAGNPDWSDVDHLNRLRAMNAELQQELNRVRSRLDELDKRTALQAGETEPME